MKVIFSSILSINPLSVSRKIRDWGAQKSTHPFSRNLRQRSEKGCVLFCCSDRFLLLVYTILMQTLTAPAVVTGIFAFFMLFYWVGAFFILYHLIRFGVGSSPKKMAVIFLAGSLFLCLITILLFGQIDFTQLSQTRI